MVEDDAAILRGLQDNLAAEGYDVITARTGQEGLERILEPGIDLAVLDVMLPGPSGFEICRRARAEGLRVPILFLTARREEVDRVMGLDLGGDDYVSKPFSVAELLARVRAILRRSGEDAQPERVAFGDVVVDFERFEATKAGRKLSMAPKEYEVLRALVAAEGRVVRRSDMLVDVWGYRSLPTTRTVDNHVALLRSKLEDEAARPRHILTVHGVGYRFVRDPGEDSPSP